jgi:N-acetylmuramoyl-L-alanine amidase
MRRLSLLFISFFLASCAPKVTNYNAAPHRTAPHHQNHTAQKRTFTPTIVIDPGHGGFDIGATVKHFEEKELTLRTSQYLKKNLEKMKYHVIMTRNRDEYIPLKARAEVANSTKSQILVSVHYNWASSPRASGIEIFYYGKAESWRLAKSKQLAQNILARMISQTGAPSRGLKEGNFCVIRETHMPAVLIECGFLTNPEELKKISDTRYLEKIAQSIAEGIDAYFEAQK